MFVGISWCVSRGPPGISFEASWGPFWGLLGTLLGASWGPLGASWGLLGAEGSKLLFGSLVWAPSWSRLGRLLGRLGGLLGLRPSWCLLWPFCAHLEASWAVLGLGSWGDGKTGRRTGANAQILQQPHENECMGRGCSHCIHVYMCKPNIAVHMRAACPIVLILVVCGLDPKYNYQLHQILLNPVGTIM